GLGCGATLSRFLAGCCLAGCGLLLRGGLASGCSFLGGSLAGSDTRLGCGFLLSGLDLGVCLFLCSLVLGFQLLRSSSYLLLVSGFALLAPALFEGLQSFAQIGVGFGSQLRFEIGDACAGCLLGCLCGGKCFGFGQS